MSAKPTTCAGCLNPIPKHIRQYKCHFAEKGFFKGDITFNPCGITYHIDCIRVGEPFRSRLPGQQGLTFPDMGCLPVFVCEACSVRSVLMRELRTTDCDLTLMKLERMRMIDTACRWAKSTMANFRSHFRRIREFESIFGCKVLKPPELSAPPDSRALPALWCQQWHAIRKPTRGRRAKVSDQLTFGSARGIRSTIGLFYLYDMLVRHPGTVLASDHNNILTQEALPNECIEYSLMIEGMARRMGVHSNPPTPL